MTSRNAPAKTPKRTGRIRLPEPPPREPDEVTNYNHLHKLGAAPMLIDHFGNPETTLVAADRWIVADTEFNKTRARLPDLLIAFGVYPQVYDDHRGYIISEQGKPPDFVLEVASMSTAEADVGEKRDYYESLGIREYWRFDETGEHHGERLAGDRLLAGRYQPLALETLAGGALQGYSEALDLYLRWEQGRLLWVNPATGVPLLFYAEQSARAETAEAQAAQERAAAEARIRELEAEIRRLRGD